MSTATLGSSKSEPVAPRRTKLLVGWSAALALFAVLQYGVSARGSLQSAILIDLAWTLAALLAASEAYRTAARLIGRERLAWLGIAAASALWLIAQLYWNYVQLVKGEPNAFPDWDDAGYLAFPLLVIGSLLAGMRREDVRSSFIRPLCNLGLITVSLFTCLGLVLSDAASRANGSTLYFTTAFAYPFLYGTAFLFALTALAIYSEQQKRFIAL